MEERINIEKELIVRIFQTANILQTFLDSNLKDSDLTTKQFYLMIMMSTFDTNPTISELSTRLGTSRQNTMQLSLKLEKSGYIAIKHDELDNRYKKLLFTEKARVFWSNRDEKDNEIITDLFKTISTEDLNITNNSLSKIYDTIQEYKGLGKRKWLQELLV